MILNGCTMTNCSMAINYRLSTPITLKPSSASFSRLPVKASFQSIRSSWGPYHAGGLLSMHLSASSTPLFGRDQGSLPHAIPAIDRLQKVTHRSNLVPRASKDIPNSFRFPPMTKRPRWWWRIIACLPYLMPLHETWMYAETAYTLHPFIENFKYVTYPFLGSLGRLPSWFLLAYFITAYLGIVRRKEWPHFFRFHVVLGMLLEIGLQVVGTVSRWLPRGLYRGTLGIHFWTTASFGFLFTVIECIRCALTGKYADVPFACDAAYIQMPYD